MMRRRMVAGVHLAGMGFEEVTPARALIGKSVGDSVEVVTPRGQKDYEVVKVKYK